MQGYGARVSRWGIPLFLLVAAAIALLSAPPVTRAVERGREGAVPRPVDPADQVPVGVPGSPLADSGDTWMGETGEENSGLYRCDSADRWFVELPSLPLAESEDTSPAYRKKLDDEKAAFRAAAAAARVSYEERYAYSTLWNGLSIEADSSQLAIISKIPGVVAVYPVQEAAGETPYEFEGEPEEVPALATALELTGTALAHEFGYTGAGVNIAIMDSGVDYNHPDLGGPGFPNARIVGGWDFVGNGFPAGPAVPDPDPMDCHGHGTHVTGIAAANGAIKGAAPGANIRAYRVLGCGNTTFDDVMLAAMEMILDDGNDILNMSIVSNSLTWPQYPTARAATNLVNKGMVVVAAAGNRASTGLYSLTAPGLGKKVIGVASLDNTETNRPAFRLGNSSLVTFNQSPNTVQYPVQGTYQIADGGSGCVGPVPGVAGKVALFARGGPCGFRVRVLNAKAGGAVAVVIHNNVPGEFVTGVGLPPLTGPGDIPAVSITLADGNLIRSLLPTTLTWGFFKGTPNPAGGVISTFSSYGLSPDLALKPDITAPGGSILSTVMDGRYGLMSGTSMAAPQVAGAAALLLEAHSHTPSQAVRGMLQNSAVPFDRVAAPSGVESTHRQGAGLLSIQAAIDATTKLEPAALALGETEGLPVSRTIHLEREGPLSVTYDITHEPAIASAPGTYTPTAASASAVVSCPPSVTVPAAGSASVEVTITEPDSLLNGGIFGGYLVFTPQGGGQTHRVPYSGYKGDYQSILYLNPAAFPVGYGNPVLRPDDSFGPSTPVTLNYADADPANDFVWVTFHTDHQPRRVRLDFLRMPMGRNYSRVLDQEYMGRNTGANTYFQIPIGAVDRKGAQIPAGTYVLRFTLLKALGDDANPAHVESWISPLITVVR